MDPGFRRESGKWFASPRGAVPILSQALRRFSGALSYFLIQRKLRSSCLEGCGTLIQPTDNFLTGPCTGTINIATVSDKFRNDIF